MTLRFRTILASTAIGDRNALNVATLYSSGRFCVAQPPLIGNGPAIRGGACLTPRPKLDLYIVLDQSSSYTDDLAHFKSEVRALITHLQASKLDVNIGLATFQDYPIAPFGNASLGDQAYSQKLDLTSDMDALNAHLDTLAPVPGAGADPPESQLAALYHTAVSSGQDLTSLGYPGANIAADQNAHFRDGATKLVLIWTDSAFHVPGDPGTIDYPGPSFKQTADALLALDPARVIGISAFHGGGRPLADLQTIASATGALAPAGGVDCDGDGELDIPEGAPLVCGPSMSGNGFGEAVTALVNASVMAAAPLAYCNNVTLVAPPGSCHVDGSVDAGSYDPDGSAVSLMQGPPGPYPIGLNPVTLTVTDSGGLSSDCVATLTVQSSTPPTFTFVPPAATVSICTAPNLGVATAVDPCGSRVTVTNNAPVVFHVGQTTVTWTARSAAGLTATATQIVTVTLKDDPACCPVGSHVMLGTSNNDVLTGTSGADCIIAKGGQDTINAMGGNDVISGGDGDDIINGGDGDDIIYGGSGQDVTDGASGNDTLFGDDGDDRLTGGAGNDFLDGGEGNDTITGGVGTDQCFGGTGSNTLLTCEVRK